MRDQLHYNSLGPIFVGAVWMISKVVIVGGGSAGFLAALALKVKIPGLRVVVIRSKEIGIIGVGEGSTVPLTTFLHGFLRADPRALWQRAEPTWKLGIKFLWGPRSHFYYPFGPQLDFQPSNLPKNIAYYCDTDMENGTPEMSFMAQDKIFQRDQSGRPSIHFNLAYHVENEKFVDYLEAFATRVGVEILDDTILEVQQNDSGVAGLVLASGKTETADLYVDCSGFRSLLLGQTLGEPFVSYKSSLFCDRAVAGGWDRTSEPVHPYTTSESMDSGWCWQIEHINRINRGYVYSSDFISDEDAEREFRSKNPKVGPTRIVKFVSGRYERGWVKNVVAIGNASGFVEPLEATALSIIAMRSALMTQILTECDGDVPQYQVDLYNQHHARIWDSIRRFLACHYRFNHHLTTPFWRHCQNDVNLAGAENFVEYYQRFGPSGLWGPTLLDSLDIFGTHGYLTILIGQKVPYQRPYTPSEQEWNIWNTQRRRNIETARTAMTVPQAIQSLGFVKPTAAVSQPR
jgi:tryptophan halogenase